MAVDVPSPRDELVLVLAPTGRDMPLACALLQERAHVPCEPCHDIADLCDKVRRGAGAVLVAEEALDNGGVNLLLAALGEQLTWSDLPVLVLAAAPDESGTGSLHVLQQRGNVTVLPRPARILTLLTAVQSALRARRRQYEVRDLLAETRHAVKQRDQFLAMLGHELRNPLGAISNALTVIDAASPAADDLETEQRGIIRRQADHLARLVDDLLDVSRITSGKIVLQRRAVDLCDLAKRAAQAVEGPARSQRHVVSVDVACDPVVVDADPVRLEQVINNLLTNAIKYTPPGGKISLSVATSDAGDNAVSAGREMQAVLRVRDNGMGIPPELLPRVFELFTQADRALDRAQGGLGIGLTLVRSLIEMHDGKVEARSGGAGAGSEFVITLPLAQRPVPGAARVTPPAPAAADAARRTAASSSSPAAGGKLGAINGKHAPKPNPDARRILIIEDQPDARRALQRLLQIWGHQVDVAEDGPAGVSAAVAAPPDVAFVDVGLPGIDGYEVARRIRAQLGPSVRLIALTGYGQPEDRDRAYRAGFDLHLVKPVDRDQLARSVTAVAATAGRRESQVSS
ncbi:MAG TPA: hybrid sensor histidine kinase/response regulator [Tepidisphaeraceae bacterium]|nr:hybrid sensor histidine kinase/response regulator [Tepidisphaeraceae bacterium]